MTSHKIYLDHIKSLLFQVQLQWSLFEIVVSKKKIFCSCIKTGCKSHYRGMCTFIFKVCLTSTVINSLKIHRKIIQK